MTDVATKRMPLCRDFANGRCHRDACRFLHAEGGPVPNARPKHGNRVQSAQSSQGMVRSGQKVKNTECFEPLARPVDMRITYDLGTKRLGTPMTSRDVLLVPNLFADFAPGELYAKLQEEISGCGVEGDKLLKLWHGDSHYIADDHTAWKQQAPVFHMIVERIRDFFGMDMQATRFNWYQDTSQWKPFHHDAAAIKAKQAATQNFTVGVSFGATRDVAFEEVKSKTVISMPQPDGCIYAFAKDTNILWKHGILKESEIRPEGRISIICWGWVDGQSE